MLLRFSFRDPDRLQSENYQLKKQSLAMVFEKGTRQMTTDVASIVVSSKNFPNEEGQK